MKKIIDEIDRRRLFRYLGNSALALPFMRTLLETEAFGASTSKRAVFFYYPSGMIGEYFHPKTLGTAYDLPLTLAPLTALRSDLVVLNNIAFAGPHGHDAGSAYALTGAQAGSVSIDNYLGDKFKAVQRSLYLGMAAGKGVGAGSKLSYQSTDPSKPLTQQSAVARSIEDNPRKAFESVFNASPGGGNGEAAVADSRKYSKSVLDYCLEDTKSLQNRIGAVEKQKLDLHLASLRELERQIQATPANSGGPAAACNKTVDFAGLENPTSDAINFYQDDKNFDKVTDIMIELAVQAMACGVSNSVFLQCSHDRSPTGMGPATANAFDMGQHEASHHGSVEANMLYFAKMQAYFMTKYAKLLTRMKSIPEGDRTLLYNSISLAFSEIGDPNYHESSRMGILLAGQAGGRLKTGHAVDAMAQSSGMFLVDSPNDVERRRKEKLGMPGQSSVTGVSYNHVLVTVLQAMGLSDNTYGNPEFGRGPIPGLLVG